jgi:integrase
MISDFLSSIGKSNTTYNNEKARISTLLTELKRWEYIPVNYADNIQKLKTTAKKNTAFPNELRLKIVEDLKQTPILYYYYLHIYYGLMRPKTVVRLQVKHIDLKRRMFNTETKTGGFVKLINDVLYNEVYSNIDLTNANPEHFVFNLYELVGEWKTSEKNKVGFYAKKFKPIKEKYNLSADYTWYSFRHSAIGNIFQNKLKELKEKGELNYIDKSIEYIMQITNHTTPKQTKQYLRGISTELHVDWSGYL